MFALKVEEMADEIHCCAVWDVERQFESCWLFYRKSCFLFFSERFFFFLLSLRLSCCACPRLSYPSYLSRFSCSLPSVDSFFFFLFDCRLIFSFKCWWARRISVNWKPKLIPFLSSPRLLCVCKGVQLRGGRRCLLWELSLAHTQISMNLKKVWNCTDRALKSSVLIHMSNWSTAPGQHERPYIIVKLSLKDVGPAVT